MDIENDYILRLIHQFGRFLRALRANADEAARRAALDAQCRESSGLGLRAVDQLTDAALTDMLPLETRLSLALTLTARAETTGVASEQAAWRLKALRLLLSCREDDAVCGPLSENLDALMRHSLDALTAEELFACADFFREGGHIDLMDNAVFFLWDTLPNRPVWRDKLTALYRGLDPAALTASGLTPAEVADSLDRLNLS